MERKQIVLVRLTRVTYETGRSKVFMLMMAPSFWHVSHHRKAVLTPFTATAEKCGQPECKRNGSDNAAQGAEVVIVVCSTPTEVLSHIIAMVEGWTPPQLHVSQLVV